MLEKFVVSLRAAANLPGRYEAFSVARFEPLIGHVYVTDAARTFRRRSAAIAWAYLLTGATSAPARATKHRARRRHTNFHTYFKPFNPGFAANAAEPTVAPACSRTLALPRADRGERDPDRSAKKTESTNG